MKGSELNAETKRDLQLLKLRGAYDPKRFYKSSDHKRGFPAHFQMGTVVEGPTEFYSSRLTKRERQQNITQELLHDADMNDARKRRFGKIQVSPSCNAETSPIMSIRLIGFDCLSCQSASTKALQAALGSHRA